MGLNSSKLVIKIKNIVKESLLYVTKDSYKHYKVRFFLLEGFLA